MRIRVRSTIVLGAVLSVLVSAAFAQKENVPGQRALPVLKDGFKFIPGTWTAYDVLDKAKNETYRMKIAALAKETVAGKPYSWLEIELEMKDAPSVVTSKTALAGSRRRSSRSRACRRSPSPENTSRARANK
jgi:hypothetical protein